MAKTIKQIADELGVTKQTVYKRYKGKLNSACAVYAHTENGVLYLDEQGEQIIKDDFANTCHSNEGLERSNEGLEHSNGAVIGAPIIESLKAEYSAEIEFLRKQVDRLQTELEKEREHNREKDKILMETLAKLAETQSVLAVGQSAEKQKELAETLIDGRQKLDGDTAEAEEKVHIDTDGVCDEALPDKNKKGFLRRVLNAIINRR